MNIPDAAIEAAAEAIYYFGKDTRYGMVLWQGVNSGTRNLYRKQARAAIEAAMPAIREAIANELHAALCTDPNCEDVCVGAANAVEVVLAGFEL